MSNNNDLIGLSFSDVSKMLGRTPDQWPWSESTRFALTPPIQTVENINEYVPEPLRGHFLHCMSLCDRDNYVGNDRPSSLASALQVAHSVNPRTRDSFTKGSSIQIFPGQLGDKPGDKRLRAKKLLILTILSAKATPELAKRTILSIKRTIGDGKPTIPLETVSKSSAGAS